MSMGKRGWERQQGWVLLGYSLAVMALFAVNRPAWRLITFGVAGSVLLLVLAMFLWRQFRGGCWEL